VVCFIRLSSPFIVYALLYYMRTILLLLCIGITFVSCRKDDVVLQLSNDSNPFCEYDSTNEFIGEYAYFKGSILDTTIGQSLDGYVLRNTQESGLECIIANGEYKLSTVRGEVHGYYNEYYLELDTVFVEIIDNNNTIIDVVYLLGNTLIYNDTINNDILF
jgi:hypothetical protein